jgi:hypothetical protein
MKTLAITDAPTIEVGAPFGDYMMAWADLASGERLPIRISRRYASDTWQVLWRAEVLRAAFFANLEEILARAEAATRIGADGLDLV